MRFQLKTIAKPPSCLTQHGDLDCILAFRAALFCHARQRGG
ncbi:MAG: hypothetical protein VKJ24_06155 [Synechococcales bacterium]|nr:hypothetical protein [Synechococcales bacterium]